MSLFDNSIDVHLFTNNIYNIKTQKKKNYIYIKPDNITTVP